MADLTIAIPARNERFLRQTIEDVLRNARGDIAVYPILDGYEPPTTDLVNDSRVTYVRLPSVPHTQKRQAINHVVDLASGPYIMALDAHCLLSPGFDVQLKSDHQPNWVQIPRRHRLDAENWCIQPQSDNRPPIDYEYIIWRSLVHDRSIHGFKWDARTLERSAVAIDDTVEFQGSCWFMTKAWFQECGFMDAGNYRGWGQEAEELSFTTWQRGGCVKTNKRLYYAHLHKGKVYGRMYTLSRSECRQSYAYAFDQWLGRERAFFIDLIAQFAPLPGWPADWKDRLWTL